MAWKGVITNKGNALLSQWVSGKTMTITKAAAGTGRVAEEAMLAQTSLVNEKQMASILSNEPAEAGQRLKLQVTPQAAAYSLNQFGVWAELEGEENMIALFQTDTETGVEIPSLADVPDFVYTFYGMLGFSGTGNLQVIVDPEALASMENVGAAVAAHNTNKEAHADLREAIRTGLDGKAPTNHAAVDTTHGAGSGSNYGHVKLSDATNSTSGASGGVAATPAAVKKAYDMAHSAQEQITTHNTSNAAHSDLRAELQELANWVKDLLDSDDETLNEMHEVVAYIKSNKELIDAITTSKVSVADIVDNLVTNVANKPLSAAQGVVLKGLIDALQTAVNGKAPTSHAASTTTYGAGSGSNYGHVKLSDSTSGTSGASGGVAATPAAVKAAYDLANTANNAAKDKAPAYSYGTTDLTAGSSALETGKLHFVYE